MPKELTITQLAEELNITRRTIYNWIDKGLPHRVEEHGLTTKVILDFDEVIQWINEEKRKG